MGIDKDSNLMEARDRTIIGSATQIAVQEEKRVSDNPTMEAPMTDCGY